MFQVLPKKTEKLYLNRQVRHFEVTNKDHGISSNGDTTWLKTNYSGRAAAVIYFKKRFGKAPSVSWGDGFMAEAWDNSGRRVMLEQLHYNYIQNGVYRPDLTAAY